jgi:hypothetical protein
MAGIVFESWARVLVLLHAAGAIVLVGASTHLALLTAGWLRGTMRRKQLGRLYPAVVAAAYAATYALGGLAYPAFRYHVRALYLDRHAVWASNLFDVKEHFASLGLPLAAGALLLSRVLDLDEDRPLLAGFAVFVFGTTAIVWFNTISGLVITMVKGV